MPPGARNARTNQRRGISKRMKNHATKPTNNANQVVKPIHDNGTTPATFA